MLVSMRTLKEYRQLLSERRANKQLRHEPAACQLAIFDHSSCVPEAVWQQVVSPDLVYLGLDYARALEASASEDFVLRFVLFYHLGQPVAAALFQIFNLDAEDIGSQANAETANGKRARFVRELKLRAENAVRGVRQYLQLRVLLCGNAFVSGEHGYVVREGFDRDVAMHALADAAYRIRRAEKLHGIIDIVMIKDFYAEKDVQAQFLTRFSYRRFEVDPNMVVKIEADWHSFDDYLLAMTSKYRKRAKTAIGKLSGIETAQWGVSEIEQHAEEIDELYQAVHKKASFRICEVTPSYLAECKRHLGDRMTFLAYHKDSVLVAFICLIQWGNKLEGHSIGLNYDHNTEHALYQNILYDCIKHAIQVGCTEVIYGRTALEMKSSVGAKPQPMWCYLRHRGPIQNRLIKPVFRYLKPSDWVERSPFKDVDE